MMNTENKLKSLFMTGYPLPNIFDYDATFLAKLDIFVNGQSGVKYFVNNVVTKENIDFGIKGGSTYKFVVIFGNSEQTEKPDLAMPHMTPYAYGRAVERIQREMAEILENGMLDEIHRNYSRWLLLACEVPSNRSKQRQHQSEN